MFNRIALIATALVALLAGTALADPFEPNESSIDPKTPLKAGVRYVATVDNPGDDDWYMVEGSGPVSVTVEVTSDACPDDYPALSFHYGEFYDAFGGESAELQNGQSATRTMTLQADESYRLHFMTFSGDACPSTKVGYAFTLKGNTGAAPSGPTRLFRRPALRRYACLHQSQGYTGFGEPAFRIQLKANGVWIDRTHKRLKRARWTYRRGITTLFTTKGTRLYRFTHWRDSKGRYLVQHPRGTDPLICR